MRGGNAVPRDPTLYYVLPKLIPLTPFARAASINNTKDTLSR